MALRAFKVLQVPVEPKVQVDQQAQEPLARKVLWVLRAMWGQQVQQARAPRVQQVRKV